MMHTHFMKRTLALISALLAGPIFAADAPHGTKAKYLLLNYSTSIASTNQAAAQPGDRCDGNKELVVTRAAFITNAAKHLK